MWARCILISFIDVLNCDDMKPKDKEKKCRQIPIYTLNEYVGSMPNQPHIHYLSVDVEGYDWLVLQGASQILKNQVHYLEFEYNWKGPWSETKLKNVIESLHNDYGFICYWPGPANGQIWRITGCWLDHYKHRYWSNVACVNGFMEESRQLAKRMEDMFLQTLELQGVVYKKK